MTKPRKAEKHMVTGKPILNVGGSDFKLPGTRPPTGYAKKKLSAVAAPGNIAASFAPLYTVVTIMGGSFSSYVGKYLGSFRDNYQSVRVSIVIDGLTKHI
jgi:hypothetical protein